MRLLKTASLYLKTADKNTEVIKHLLGPMFGAGAGYAFSDPDKKLKGTLIGAGAGLGVGELENLMANKIFYKKFLPSSAWREANDTLLDIMRKHPEAAAHLGEEGQKFMDRAALSRVLSVLHPTSILAGGLGGKHLVDKIPSFSAEKTSKEKLVGGLGDRQPDSKFDPEQLAMGVKVEKEHTLDKSKAKEIAKDHLMESPVYYTHLDKMEKKLEKLHKKAYFFGRKTASQIC